MYLKDEYKVIYGERTIGYYYVFSDDSISYSTDWGCPWDIEEELKALKLDKRIERKKPLKLFTDIIREKYRVAGTMKKIYQKDMLRLERYSRETDERFSVYRRSADEGDPDYSPLRHDAPHYEGPHTPEGMREWASYYLFVKMDDGTYQAQLDEAWWWGGGHNDGGVIRTDIPEEWFRLPYDEFLEKVVTLSAAAHYGFTAEILKEREGLKKFFGYEE